MCWAFERKPRTTSKGRNRENPNRQRHKTDYVLSESFEGAFMAYFENLQGFAFVKTNVYLRYLELRSNLLKHADENELRKFKVWVSRLCRDYHIKELVPFCRLKMADIIDESGKVMPRLKMPKL